MTEKTSKTSNNDVYNYKPNPNTNGLDSLKIKVLDLFSSSNEVKVIFRVLNNNQSVNSDNILLFPNPTSSYMRLRNLDLDQIFIQNIINIHHNKRIASK